MAKKYLFKTAGGNYLKIGSNYAAIPDPSIGLDIHFIPFAPAGSVEDVVVTSTFYNPWTVDNDAASWVTISSIVNSEAAGDGVGSFTATAPANNTANRTGQLQVGSRYGGWQPIDVSQNKIVVADSISLDPNWLNWPIEDAGVEYATYVTASGSWTSTITSDPDNIVTARTTSGAGSQTAYITVNNPAVKTPRYAQITYTRGTATAIIDLCIEGELGGICVIP